MVSLIKYGALSGGEKYNTNILEIDGLSTDTKPITTFIEYGVDGREIGRTNIENGSIFTEIDTGKLFMYDAENTVWYEIVTSGGGGGGGGTDNYNLLTNKPKINNVEIKGNKSLVDLGILFGSSLVAEIDSSTYVVTLTLKDQEGNILGEPQSLDLPLESVVVGGRYDNTTKKVILTLQNGNTVEFSVADLVDGLQSELSSTNKLNPEFINYNSTHRAVSDAEKTAWNGKQNALTTTQLAAVNSGIDSTKVTQIETNKEGIGAMANRGSKNIVDIQKPTTITRCSYTILANGGVELNCADAQWTSYAIANIDVESGKTYVIKFLLDESSGTNDFYFFLREDNSSGSNLATKSYGSTTGEYVAEFTPTTDIAWLGIYLNNSATARTATAKVRCAIMPKVLYDADSTYVPYAPTNRELYEMILALQPST